MTATVFYTPEELAASFKVTRSELFRLRKERGWPYHLFGSEMRFSADDLEVIRAMTLRAKKK